MLNVTDGASKVIRSVTERQELPEQGGLRITVESPQVSANGRGPEPMFQLSLVADPEPGDQRVEIPGGGQIFIETDATAFLDDKVLDARVTSDGKVAFKLLHAA